MPAAGRSRKPAVEAEVPRTPAEAADRLGPVRRVAGADAHYDPDSGRVRAAVVVCDARTLAPCAHATAERPIAFPYVPGLLAVREGPAVLAALAELDMPPDLLLADGHGLAHPRGFGLACWLGLAADLPTVGVGKRRLAGAYAPPARERGASTPLVHAGREVGRAVRTRTGVRPVFVSVGHRVSLATAMAWTLACAPRFRLPEPLRLADRLARRGTL